MNSVPQGPSSQPGVLIIQAVGDVNLGGSAERLLPFAGYDYAFWGTRHLLQTADINVANLEAPVGEGGQLVEKRFTYLMEPKAYWALRREGFNLFSLANNHILDFGPEVLRQTMDILRQGGSGFAGAGENEIESRRPAIVERKGVRVGFLAYSLTFPEDFYATQTKAGTAFGHEAHIKEDVAALRGKADVILVSFHWGSEGMKEPKPYQQLLAHAAIDSGADVVIGHHPHVVQGVEAYKGRPIFYSLGNFAFGSYSNRVEWGALARLTFSVENPRHRPKLLATEIIPMDVNNFRVDFCPMPAVNPLLDHAFQEINFLSEPFGSRLTLQPDRKSFLWNVQ